jgi:hypothetical protein
VIQVELLFIRRKCSVYRFLSVGKRPTAPADKKGITIHQNPIATRCSLGSQFKQALAILKSIQINDPGL